MFRPSQDDRHCQHNWAATVLMHCHSDMSETLAHCRLGVPSCHIAPTPCASPACNYMHTVKSLLRADERTERACAPTCHITGTVSLVQLESCVSATCMSATCTLLKVCCLQVNVPQALAFSATGRQLAIGDKAGGVHVHDTLTQRRLVSLPPQHKRGVLCLAFSPSDAHGCQYLASSGMDGAVHVYDATRVVSGGPCTLMQSLDEHSGAATAVAFLRGGAALVSCGQDRKIVFRCAPRWLP